MADVRPGVVHAARRGGRRGLLTGAAALLGAGLTKLTGPGRTESAHDTGGTPEVLHTDVRNTTTAMTSIEASIVNEPAFAVKNPSTAAFNVSGDAIHGVSANGPGTAGVYGHHDASTGRCYGVRGFTYSSTEGACGVVGAALFGLASGVIGVSSSAASNATGVFGDVSASSGATVGVWGRTQSNGNGAMGVYGQATATSGDTIAVRGTAFSPTGTGVHGRGQRYGVLGESPTGTGIGVRGRVDSGTGVFGSCEGPGGSGVYGESITGSNGVLGVSNQGTGVVGKGGQYGVLAEALVGSSVALRARTGTGLGVYGSSTDQNGSGVYGENTSGGGIGVRAYSQGVALYAQGGTRAAVFVGDVEIRGNLIRSGGAGGAPDGAVRDGGSRSASGRIGDDGRGRLVNGRGTVTLDPAFVAAADASDYDVTVTPYGEFRPLFVAARTPTGFEVRDAQGGTSTLEFGYRISARAKAGAPGRGNDLGPGGAGARGTDGPAIVAPEIPPAWREGGPRPDANPPAWRDAPMPPDPVRDGD